MTQTSQELPSWILIITAYIIPAISALYLVYSNYKKDKASYNKTNAETETIDEESDRLDGKLSLEWVREFRTSQKEAKDQLEQTTKIVMDQQKNIAELQTLLRDANLRIIKLESENSALVRKNIMLEDRIKILETENEILKGLKPC
ncbi:MAG: hypothetical protein CVU46_10505 [Chloroflexi bacterium HGW-Chloroflexi-8]|nr:MAG: hypothetical protein CVU46_10505 [Chloroflexi bacterium HGW-Chloroflexi-8]